MLTLVILTSLCFIPIQEAAVHPYGDARGYDRSMNVFDTRGELMQTRYAEEASSRGETIVCVTAGQSSELEVEQGPCQVVLGISSKAEDTLLDRAGIDKVSKVDDNVWVACTGLAGDGRALLRIARTVCANYRTRYGTPPSLQYLANAIGDMQHEFTLSGRERPYGVSLMLIGYDEDSLTPQVYISRVDGSVSSWSAVSVGKQSGSCMEYLTESLTEDFEHRVPSLERAAEVVVESLNLPALHREEADADNGADGDGNGKGEDKGGDKEGAMVGDTDQGSNVQRPCDIYVFRRESLDQPATLRVHSKVRRASDL